jgi:hypothetical protein
MNSTTLSAITGPTPSTAARSSTGAAVSDSSDPNADARARATVGPTWRMPSATSSRLRGWRFDASIAPSRLAAESSPRPSSPTNAALSIP